MMPDHFLPRTLLCTILLAAATFSYAEKADRRKPVNLEADRVTVDEVNKVHLFDGRVTLSQGTLAIRADKLVVRQDAEGFQNGIATGIPVGADLEYADEVTLARAMKGRQKYEE